MNEILSEEQNIVKEISFKKHGGPIHKTEINKLFLKGVESMCKFFFKEINIPEMELDFFANLDIQI